jgi:hypothetical protein
VSDSDTRSNEQKIADAEAAIAGSRNPSPRLRAAAKVIHDHGVRHAWRGIPNYAQTYEELEQVDPIGFGEFNEIVAEALAAADAA